MRQLRFCRSMLLLFLPVAIAGCSSTLGSKFGGTPKSKSIAVVGDQPQAASTGEPGGQVVADAHDSEPRRNPRTRISGRVVDDQGQPVPDTTVRLADGSLKGGKDIRTTTDQSGAFTLNGLRPDSSYLLIAEGDGDHGPLSGRAEARTAQTGVEIMLASDATTTTRKSPRTSRAKPISNREEFDDPGSDSRSSGINNEDLPLPADDASSLDSGPSSKPTNRRPQLSAPESTVGWRNSSAVKAAQSRNPDAETVARKTSEVDRSIEDEGPNPLPPAIDNGPTTRPDDSAPPPVSKAAPRRKTTAKPPPKPNSGEIAFPDEANAIDSHDRANSIAQPSAKTFVASHPLAMPAVDPDPPAGSEILALPASSKSTDIPALANASADPPRPTASPPSANQEPQSLASKLPASEPVFASLPVASPTETRAEYNPFALVASNEPEPEPRDKPEPILPVRTSPPPSSPDPTPSAPVTDRTVPEAPKKKWGEVAASEKRSIAVEPTKATATASLVRRLRNSVEGRVESHDPSVAACSYDPRFQKITEFRLPDLEGKPVRYQDLDADYVLLDFWGTWCPPCLDSIPHLIALQKKYGPSRFRVVGIACEEVPPDQRKAKVEEVSRRLGINYAVLLSGIDGKPCPVQQALQIQAFPTMVLLDRRGQVIWRSAGSTPASRDRLDRVIASSLSRAETVRR